MRSYGFFFVDLSNPVKQKRVYHPQGVLTPAFAHYYPSAVVTTHEITQRQAEIPLQAKIHYPKHIARRRQTVDITIAKDTGHVLAQKRVAHSFTIDIQLLLHCPP